VKVLPPILYGSGRASYRSALAGSAQVKVEWFLHQPVVNVLNFTNIQPDPAVAVWFGVAILLGLWCYFDGSRRERIGKLLIAVALIPLTYLPNLLVAEDWASYRTTIALGALIVLYLVLAIQGFVDPWKRQRANPRAWIWKVAVALSLCTIALIFALQAQKTTSTEFVMVSTREARYLNQRLAVVQATHPTTIYMVLSSWQDSPVPIVRYDEFGTLTSEQPWTAQPMVSMILEQDGYSGAFTTTVILVEPGAVTSLPPGSIVIDMRGIRHEQKQPVQPTTW
jgi:hypothetical protein